MSRGSALVRTVRQRVRRHRPRGGILMYHCICRAACDPWAICVSPPAFDEQMDVLARARAAVGLAAFAHDDVYTRDGARLAVTFDDGYVDNLFAALPVLERHEIPATIFVVGNAVGRTREFWWDALERAVLSSDSLPDELRFRFGDAQLHFVIADRPGDLESAAAWRADSGETGTARQTVFRTLWDAIVVLEPTEQDAAVEYLLTWAGQPLVSPTSRLPVSGDQFAELADHDLIELGSHTLDHVSLTDLPPEGQRVQIYAGHRMIEELSGRPVTQFAFPFGRFDDSAHLAVRDLGVDVACTSVPMATIVSDDRRALPRLQATEMDGDQFARWLSEDHALLT